MLTWIIGGLSVWTLGILFVLALMRMASDQDRAARHEELLRNLSLRRADRPVRKRLLSVGNAC
jgi:hypothetical protein